MHERSFVVRGGLLWFHHVLVAGIEVDKAYSVGSRFCVFPQISKADVDVLSFDSLIPTFDRRSDCTPETQTSRIRASSARNRSHRQS
jgi:hypothetical protein